MQDSFIVSVETVVFFFFFRSFDPVVQFSANFVIFRSTLGPVCVLAVIALSDYFQACFRQNRTCRPYNFPGQAQRMKYKME